MPSQVKSSGLFHGYFNLALRPRKPEGSLGRTAQDGHLDSHTAPELCQSSRFTQRHLFPVLSKHEVS